MAVPIKCSNCCPVMRDSSVIVILWTQGQGDPCKAGNEEGIIWVNMAKKMMNTW